MRVANLVPARLTHINPLAFNMREADRIECEALGRTPKEALRLSLRTSFDAVTALDPDDGRPLAMFGVTSLSVMSGIGVPWFLGRDEVFDYARDLLLRGPGIIAQWQETFEVMENIVAADNLKAIRLLRCWGAQVGCHPSTRHRGIEFVTFRFERA